MNQETKSKLLFVLFDKFILGGALLLIGWLAQGQISKAISLEFKRKERLEEVYATKHELRHAITDLGRGKVAVVQLRELQRVARKVETALLKASLYTEDGGQEIHELQVCCVELCVKIDSEVSRQKNNSNNQAVPANYRADNNKIHKDLRNCWKAFDKMSGSILESLSVESGLDPLKDHDAKKEESQSKCP